jgi:hypothetical protein
MTKTIRQGETNRATSADVSIADPSATVALTGEQGREAVCTSNQQPVNACEEAIRVRAHSKWEAAGCPAGDGFDIWLEAEREVNAERTG